MTTAYSYATAASHLAAGDIDYTTDTIKALLLTSSHTLDVQVDEFVSDVSAEELSGGGYVRKTLASKTSTLTGPTLTLDCADISWTSLTATNIRYVVFFKDTGSDATSILLCANDLEANYSPTAQNFDFTVSTTGLIQIAT